MVTWQTSILDKFLTKLGDFWLKKKLIKIKMTWQLLHVPWLEPKGLMPVFQFERANLDHLKAFESLRVGIQKKQLILDNVENKG